MAIDPVRAGAFIPNKAGEPEGLAEPAKTRVKESAEAPTVDSATDQATADLGSGSGGVDVKA